MTPYLAFREAFVALDPDRHPDWFIDSQVALGVWRCWGNDKAAILAEIKTYPTGLKEVHGVGAAGDLTEIVSLIPLAEEWGRQNGCVRAIIESREGWLRMLPDYCAHTVAARKEL